MQVTNISLGGVRSGAFHASNLARIQTRLQIFAAFANSWESLEYGEPQKGRKWSVLRGTQGAVLEP